tara:strand:- start:336 stop:476 length:141 start_codon:yes stop_codon:yes gene_type:complete
VKDLLTENPEQALMENHYLKMEPVAQKVTVLLTENQVKVVQKVTEI